MDDKPLFKPTLYNENPLQFAILKGIIFLYAVKVCNIYFSILMPHQAIMPIPVIMASSSISK